MRFNKFVPSLLVVLLLGYAATTHAQQDPNDEAVRGSFITSRPPAAAGGGVGGGIGASASTGSSGKSTSTKSSSRNTGKSTGKSSGRSTSGKSTGKSTTATVAVKTYSNAPIGLGYTLYMKDGMGDAVRVDPYREFRTGEAIRLSMEANTDGYLYVFHTENDNAPTLIFPDYRLNDGDNSIEAHVPYEVPSPFEANPSFRWFTFTDPPARERLYIVITRQPLPGIPIGDNLVSHCKTHRCPLSLNPEIWAKAKQGSSGGVKVSRSKTYGQPQTQGERDATTRGLGLSQSAPEPSVVRMNVSTNDSVLVTTLDLVHN